MLVSRVRQYLQQLRFFRGEGPQTKPVVLHRRNVYILPTRQGLFFTVVLLVMLIGSINYSNSLGYMLTFLLASLTVISIMHTYRNLLNLRISIGHINPVFLGQDAAIPLIIDNLQQNLRFSIEISFPEQEAENYDLTAEQTQRIEIHKNTFTRGMNPLGRFVMTSRFPLGLFRAWANVEPDRHTLVYPQPAADTELPGESLYVHKMLGDQGHGADDFAGLRNYRSGDSMRHIHWKALAREQGLLTKQFGGDRSDQLWLDWRMLSNMNSELKLSYLCRWVLEAEQQGYDYGLWLPGKVIEPGRGELHQHQCLEALALFDHNNEPDA